MTTSQIERQVLARLRGAMRHAPERMRSASAIGVRDAFHAPLQAFQRRSDVPDKLSRARRRGRRVGDKVSPSDELSSAEPQLWARVRRADA